MDVIISEKQNQRIINLIKKVGESFSDEILVRTEIKVGYNSIHKLYVITPTFYVKDGSFFLPGIYIQILKEKIEDYIGVPVYCDSERVEEVYI